MKLSHHIAILAAMSLAVAAHAASLPAQTVTASRLIEAARKALPASGADSTVTAQALGTVEDAIVPGGTVRLQSHPVVGRWPRARAAVPVTVLVDGKPVRSEVIWFDVSALCSAWVYVQDAQAGTAIDKLKVQQSTVDIAKANGRPVETLAALANSRLRRGVHAGWPLLETDFEPIPDVDRQSRVIVHVRYGAIRMETIGQALNTGEVGDVVPVLVNGAASPVQAKVAGKGEVDIAR